MTIELCTDSVESSVAVQHAGVTRIELCASLAEGGITPAFSLMQKVCSVLTIPVNVMIRPRGGDFLYSDEEFNLMKSDVRHAQKAGASGVVFGILRSDGTIDRKRCVELIALAAPLEITFHRAFDMTSEPFFALEEIIAIGCNSLLTSGQSQTAEDGLELIRELVKRAGTRIEVMAGSGITSENVMLLHEAGVKAFHFTARTKMPGNMSYRNDALKSMGTVSGNDEFSIYTLDEMKVRGIVKALSEA